MIFSSVFFIFVFLPLTLLIYYVVPKPFKNIVLFIFSLIFYAWGEPVYIVLMLFSITFNYFSGLELEKAQNEGKEKEARISFIITIIINLGILGFFKYFGFVMENINSILPFDIPYKELSLPIGISFYTFQTLSYIIDVYKEKISAQKNYIAFGTYVSMFPQLIAGPIVKYTDIEKQLENRKITTAKFGDGVAWFLRGLAKKVLLANNIGMAFDAITALPGGEMSVLTAWIGCAAYTMQIYFDFSGYSDMAIGLGKMLGFEFLINFDHPYISKSITEFWRRWHISLGAWFREYVYIPLGGNRVDKKRHIRNILVVWLLTGLWHGASWNFVFWGIYYGAFMLVEKYLLKPIMDKIPPAVCHIYTMLVVMIGWVFFAMPSMGSATRYLLCMFGIGSTGFIDGTSIYYLCNYFILFVITIICSGEQLYKRFKKHVISERTWENAISIAAYGVIFLISIAYLINATYNPFLYFRF